jgi:hypothetical protein
MELEVRGMIPPPFIRYSSIPLSAGTISFKWWIHIVVVNTWYFLAAISATMWIIGHYKTSSRCHLPSFKHATATR